MLYMHVPFCERLCPYCPFNRFPFKEERAKPYFANMRKEMMMLKDLGYDFESVYIGGGTPTITIDELCETIDMARENFSIKEVSSETNPNHLIPSYLEKLKGASIAFPSACRADDGLLKQSIATKSTAAVRKSWSASRRRARISVHERRHDFQLPGANRGHPRSTTSSAIESGASQNHVLPAHGVAERTASLARTVGKVDYKREQQRFSEII